MVKVTFKENMFGTIGKPTLMGLAVLVDGKELYTFDKNALAAIIIKNDAGLAYNVLHYLQMGNFKLPKADLDSVVKLTVDKIRSISAKI